MYCPKCSQQQVSEEVRFCSRCGFSLSAVRELVTSSNLLPERGAEMQAGQVSRSQRGVRKGAWLMLASLALAIVAGLLSAIEDDFAILLFLPLLGLVLGFVRVLYGIFFEEKRAKKRAELKAAASQANPVPLTPGQFGNAASNPQLSPPRVAPIEGFTAHKVETAEMVRPPSVTENTTRLLDEKAGERPE